MNPKTTNIHPNSNENSIMGNTFSATITLAVQAKPDIAMNAYEAGRYLGEIKSFMFKPKENKSKPLNIST